ncbi:MAG TPA: hypothetical protein VN193_05705 [Candidatus Angelobacter sp.]|jgi:hypothetical protein|nr:hypothetical protein [Candidatus Angelobacter sp.]
MEPLHIGRETEQRSRVVVRFSDDEVLEGDAVELDLDQPDFELVLVDPDANSRRALIPLPSVKFVTFARRTVPARDDVRTMQKVALHFVDGEVITGLLGGDPRRGRYGVQLELLSREGDEVELLGIPYDALKAVFFLRTWDGSIDVDAVPTPDTPLVDLLRELRHLSDSRDRGDIDDGEFHDRRRDVLDRM